MMDSDLSTFRSSLIREAQPDFRITVGSYQWTVHAKKLEKSSFFQKLIANNNNNAVIGSRNVILQDDEPLLIGHLVLWLYTGEYMEHSLDDGTTVNKGLDIQDIMKNGKVENAGSPHLGTPTASSLFCSEDDDQDEWDIPVALHAKMFILAEKFGIGDLATKTIDDFKAELEWNADDVFIPSLKELFSNGGSDANNHPPIPPLPPILHGSASTPSTPPLSSADGGGGGGIGGNYSSTPLPGSEMFDLLAATASNSMFLSKYLAQADFEKVMVENPAFQFEVLRRVARELDHRKLEIEASTPKPVKTPRKRRLPSKSVERGEQPKSKKVNNTEAPVVVEVRGK